MRPSTVMVPVSGRIVRVMHLSVVDLPHPFSPTSPNVVPRSTSKLTSSTAWNSWNRARRPRMTAALRERLRSS